MMFVENLIKKKKGDIKQFISMRNIFFSYNIKFMFITFNQGRYKTKSICFYLT